MTTNICTPGALIKARGREWLVLPDSSEKLILARPLGGLDEEITGIVPHVESVESATFSLPDHHFPGDHNACRLLRDAARLVTRSAAGPFRSFARIAVDPRPYQLVPLMVALRLDPVRMLIADDVGIGKTIEALLIARELLDRGEVRRMALLCPPHLAEQWQREMKEKFHIDAELILTSTIQKLERGLPANVSVFDRYPVVILSTDFIKTPKRRDDFLLRCPELVIVDEAHTCTVGDRSGKARQHRFDLLRQLGKNKDRHLILVTATPHSGNEYAFRSLLSLLDEKFSDLPEDLDSKKRDALRRQLANHLVQRRRADIRRYLEKDTFFPAREDAEIGYNLSPSYKSLFEKILAFAQEMVDDKSGTKRHQRVRWWSALSLLRALASSPAAAEATLKNRAETAEAQTDEDVEEKGKRAVFDQDVSETTEALDFTPGADTSDIDGASGEGGNQQIRQRLLTYARQVKALSGEQDNKLQVAIKHIKRFLKDGFHPMIFCRFIDTADYLARELRNALSNVEVISVTGILPPSEREDRIKALVRAKKYVLVCTDCLSEGINLQEHFDAVMHYDLAWNPTRHEQREGRVDRFGQDSEIVRVLTYYGLDNGIDGVILDVLIQKHKKIKNALGISIAIPGSSEQIVDAIFQGLLLREKSGKTSDALLPGLEEYFLPQKEDIHMQWDNAAEKEKISRSRFAQHTLAPDDVAAELAAVQEAIGSGQAAEQFFKDALRMAKVPISEKAGTVEVNLSNETPRSLRQALGCDKAFQGKFDLPISEDQVYLARTSPEIEGMASWVLDTALDKQGYDTPAIAKRCGVICTKDVDIKTTLLLLRYRYHLLLSAQPDRPILAEEIRTLAFTGSVSQPNWIAPDTAKKLLQATPSKNIAVSLASQQLEHTLSSMDQMIRQLEQNVTERGEVLLQAHQRVRQAAKATGKITVEPVLPLDILGCYIYLPE